jgi:hypothetical protein
MQAYIKYNMRLFLKPDTYTANLQLDLSSALLILSLQPAHHTWTLDQDFCAHAIQKFLRSRSVKAGCILTLSKKVQAFCMLYSRALFSKNKNLFIKYKLLLKY